MPRRISIRAFLTCTIILVILLPSAMIASWLWYGAKSTLLTEAFDRSQEVSHVERALLESEVRRVISLLENKSDSIAIALERPIDRSLIPALMHKIFAREPAFIDIAVIDRQANAIDYLTRPVPQAAVREPPLPDAFFDHYLISMLGLPRETLPVVTIPLSGRVFIGPAENRNGVMSFSIAVPIGKAQDLGGALIGRLDIEEVWNNVRSTSPVERKGYKYLVNRRGDLLASSVPADGRLGSLLTHMPIIRAALSGSPWNRETSYSGLGGAAVYGSYTPVDLMNWTLVSEIPTQDITNPIVSLLRKGTAVITVISIIFLLVGLVAVSKMMIPVRKITEASDLAAKGTISEHMPSSAISEFDAMYRSFEAMNTARRDMEERLRRSQRLEAVGQLTGGLAHDFNNLLGIMLGNTEFLALESGDDEKLRHHVKAIIAAIDRGSSLTQRLLAFSCQTALMPVSSDTSRLIVGLHDMLRRTLGETIALKVETTADLWHAMIDPHQFENALVNLAVNARDAMPQGGTLTIETANATLDASYAEQHEDLTPGDFVMVAVSDTGTGMSPEVRAKVFEPFFTTKEVGKGSGLGLSMVYGFVRQSEGHIAIASEVGRGTTVKLYMPRSRAPLAQRPAREETSKFDRGSERILVVEDDENVREIPASILRDQGYEVVEAGDGQEAITRLKNGQSFELLFTDLVLRGGMNGLEIAKEAKRLQPGIKVLYTTGYTENTTALEGHLDPDVTLLNKPYRRAELLDMVGGALNHAPE